MPDGIVGARHSPLFEWFPHAQADKVKKGSAKILRSRFRFRLLARFPSFESAKFCCTGSAEDLFVPREQYFRNAPEFGEAAIAPHLQIYQLISR